MKKEMEKKDEAAKFFEEPTEEQLQQEFQEILKKREAYWSQQEKGQQDFQKEKQQERTHKISTLAKVAVFVLVIGGSLFFFSMRSEATRLWWLKATEREIGEESGHVVNNDENRVFSSTEEMQAIAEIEEKTGIPMPELIYKPEGMSFDGYEYGEENCWAYLYYLYGDYVIRVKAYTTAVDTAYSENFDGEVIAEGILETAYGIVKLQEIKAEDDKVSTTISQWVYHNHLYFIEGKVLFEEMKKIIENIFY